MAYPLDAPLHAVACDRQDPRRDALVHRWADGKVDRLRFADLAVASQALAKRLGEAGIRPGMRVALSLPACPVLAVAHLACSRVGAITVPLPPVLGPDALRPRLGASLPALGIVDAQRVEAFAQADPEMPLWPVDGRTVKTTRGALPPEILDSSRGLVPPGLPSTERAMSLFFTSGTTATPKAALLPHRVVAGRMPGFLRAHPGFDERALDERRFWSPAEWSWIGGLHDALFAPWLAGGCVVSAQRTGHFDPAHAAELVREHGVASAFLPPTALKLWRRSGAPAPKLVSLHTAGESLPAPVLTWAKDAFGAPPREVYGLTEAAFVLVNDDAEPGVTGTAASGAEVAVFDVDTGEPAKPGEEGEVRVRAGAPTMMLGYLAQGAVELPLDRRGWLRTGDVGRVDARGRVTILGRTDDVIKTSGYRVAPGEIEAALLHHDGVVECAVVGVPDPDRGQAIKAFVRVGERHARDAAFAKELQDHVRRRVAAYMVPREVEFVDELPTTVNGKLVRRELRK